MPLNFREKTISNDGPRLLFEIIATIAVAETCIMFILPVIVPGIQGATEAFLDAALLTLMAGPIIFWRVECARQHTAGKETLAPVDLTRRMTVGVVAILLTGLVCTAAAVSGASKEVNREARANFDRLTERITLETQRRVNQVVYGLKGLRGLYAARESVSRKEFAAYVASRDVPEEFPGARGLGVFQRVLRQDLDAFVSAERADIAPDFAVHSLLAPGSGLENAPDLYVVKHAVPCGANVPTWGLDLGSEPVRRDAIERTVQTGEPTISGPIALVQDEKQRVGFIYSLPMYKNGTHPTTPQEREATLVGLVYAPIVLDEALAGVAETANGKLDFQVFDGERTAKDTQLSDHGHHLDDAHGEIDDTHYAGRMFVTRTPITVGGRIWTVIASTTPTFEAGIDRSTPMMIGTGGILLSVLLAGIVWSLGMSRTRVVTLARSMTAELAASEQQMRTIFDTEPECVKVVGPDGAVLEMNAAGLAMLEADSVEQVRELTLMHFILPEYHAAFADLHQRVMGGATGTVVFEVMGLRGTQRWLDTRAAPLRNQAGEVTALLSVTCDITEYKRAEAFLDVMLDLEMKLSVASEPVEAATIIFAAADKLWAFDAGALDLYLPDQDLVLGVQELDTVGGVRQKVRLANPISEPSERFRRIVKEGAQLILRQPPYPLPTDAIMFGDTSRPSASILNVPIRWKERPVGILSVQSYTPNAFTEADLRALQGLADHCAGTLERIRVNEELRDSEKRFRTLLEGTEVIAWEFDVEADRFSYVSPQAALLGYPLETWFEPGFWAAHIHTEDLEEAVEYCRAESLAGRTHRFQYRMIKADGSTIWFDDFVSVEHCQDGPAKLCGVLIDITERMETQEELKFARARAEAASKTKSAFLANMSHEIRTPLTSILGYTDLLAEDGKNVIPPEERIRTINTIRNAGVHLLTVINDILDLSKIEADKLTIERVDISLIGILFDIESILRPPSAGKGVTLSTNLATPVPERVISDPTRLRQILMNIVGNAVKFTESGSITITVCREVRDGRDRLTIDIEDTGPGMTPEQSNCLFQAFGQADETVTRKHGGTGLGLIVSKRLAELMGGTVTLVRTVLDEGSCFRLDLPLDPAPGTAMVSRLDPALRSRADVSKTAVMKISGRVILAEDGPDIQGLIAFHLRKAGATVDVADNGRIALELIEKNVAAGTPYDLLLTDMQMPELDGYTLARMLRRQGSTIPIVALTAHAMVGDCARCIDAGCDAYATKPIDKEQLLAICATWMRGPGGATHSTQAQKTHHVTSTAPLESASS